MRSWVYNTGYMANRKLSEESFNRGPLNKIINKQARAAHLSSKGVERLKSALMASTANVAKKEGLRYGVGANHIEDLKKFVTSKKFEGRREFMRPDRAKEREVYDRALGAFLKVKPSEPEVEIKAEPKVELKTKIVPKAPEPSPQVANDNELKEAA